MKVAALVPTYCGADVLPYFFEGISSQLEYLDVLLFVIKPCPKYELESTYIINNVRKNFPNKIKVVSYTGEYGLVKQIILGLNILKRLGFDIVIFLDDDSYIIDEDFVKKHVKWYRYPNVGGVAGRIINVKKVGNTFIPMEDPTSIPPKRLYLWRKPASLFLGKYIPQTYITAGGYVATFGNDTYHVNRGVSYVFSLLGGGPNMSIRLNALSSVNSNILPNMSIAMRYEQILGYHIMKKGYIIIKDYNVPVYHLYRERGETRAPVNSRRGIITASDDFIYYYLKDIYKSDFKMFYKLISLVQRLYRHTFIEIKLAKQKPLNLLIARMLGQLFGNIIGVYYCTTSNKDHIYYIFKKYEKLLKKLLKE